MKREKTGCFFATGVGLSPDAKSFSSASSLQHHRPLKFSLWVSPNSFSLSASPLFYLFLSLLILLIPFFPCQFLGTLVRDQRYSR